MREDEEDMICITKKNDCLQCAVVSNIEHYKLLQLAVYLDCYWIETVRGYGVSFIWLLNA